MNRAAAGPAKAAEKAGKTPRARRAPAASRKRGRSLLALEGSPRPHGLTALLLDRFLERAGRRTQITRFSPWRTPVAPCDGCGRCFTAPGCALHDADPLFARLEEADFLVVATPVYLLSMPAPLKAVFDRFQRYYGAWHGLRLRPAIAVPKRAFFIVTAGSGSQSGAQAILRQAGLAFSVMNVRIEGCFFLPGADHLESAVLKSRLDELETRAAEFYHGPFF